MKRREKVIMVMLSAGIVIAAAQWYSIRLAEAYMPPQGVVCLGSGQLAVNIYTGAFHTFSGCVPPGWHPLTEGAQ